MPKKRLFPLPDTRSKSGLNNLRAAARDLRSAVRSFLKRYAATPPPKNFVGEQFILRGQSGIDRIFNQLSTGNPCLIARLGTTETAVLTHFERHKTENTCVFPSALKSSIADLSGFFPATDRNLIRFCFELKAAIAATDLMGVRWEAHDSCFWHNENLALRAFCPQTALVGIEHIIAPFESPAPWMRYLKGKKVLVVHPFSRTIEAQYNKRSILFGNPNNLPDFELITLTAVQSLADHKRLLQYQDWFAALDGMCEAAGKIDFDVALIGAGAYGIFLGAYCKKLGKQAIHIGGATQMFFGIKGKRWVDSGPDNLAHIMNEHWVYPSDDERPDGAERVENACYW